VIALAVAVLLATSIADIPPLRSPARLAAVLAKYEARLAERPSPRVVTFEYTVEQTGARDLAQAHRVFRSGTDQRDEIIAIDGHKLTQPVVRITHGHRDRYAVEALAPRTAAYNFRYLGPRRNGRHDDFVFATTPRTPGDFRVTQIVIDGATGLPTTIAFETAAHAGSGEIAFAAIDAFWVPTLATARATYAKLAARERISFSHYRFPGALPPGTFAAPRPLPTIKPATL
jgi:hypothetical protein